MAMSKGQVLTAERLGKHKTSWQIITVLFFLTLLAIAEWSRNIMASDWWQRAWNEAGAALVWLTVALTLYSGLGYAWRHRAVIEADLSEDHRPKLSLILHLPFATPSRNIARLMSVTATPT